MADSELTPKQIRKQKHAVYMRLYRAKHPERCREVQRRSQRKYEAKNSDRVRASRRQAALLYRRVHPEKSREKCRRYKVQHAAELKRKRAAYRREHPDEVRQKEREYYQKHREQECERSRRYWKENREKAREAHQRWTDINREKGREYRRNRKARIRGAEGKHTATDIERLFNLQNGKCAACKTRLSKTGKHRFHVDHVQPISRGGNNSPENLQLLCGPCNQCKHTKTPEQWAEKLGKLFI